jgi:hypothetical protein
MTIGGNRTVHHHHHHHHGPHGPRQPLSGRTTAVCFGAALLFIIGGGLIAAGGVLLGKAIDADASASTPFIPAAITNKLNAWNEDIASYTASSGLIPDLLGQETTGNVNAGAVAATGSLVSFTTQVTQVAPSSGNVQPTTLPDSYALVAGNVSIADVTSAFATNGERFVVTLITSTPATGETTTSTITLPYVQKRQTRSADVKCTCPGTTACTCDEVQLARTACTDVYSGATYYSYGVASCGRSVTCGTCAYNVYIGSTVCHTLQLTGDGTAGNAYGWAAGSYSSCVYPFDAQPLTESAPPANDLVTLKLVSELDPRVTLGVETQGTMAFGTVAIDTPTPRGGYYAMIAIGAVALIGAVACLCLFNRWVKEEGVVVAVDGNADAPKLDQGTAGGVGNSQPTMMVAVQPALGSTMGYHPSANVEHQWATNDASPPGFGLAMPPTAHAAPNEAPNRRGFM